jgi:hypothetical protein
VIECKGELRHIARNSAYSGKRSGGWDNEARNMKKLVLVVLSIAMLLSVAPVPAFAGLGVIDRACRNSDRQASSPKLCSCIQKVANANLNIRERRKVAKWFKDPSKAEQVRMSDRSGDEALWQKYKAFGKRAQSSCKA